MTTANRPGLSALAYRVGTHAAFFETMQARLSSIYLDIARDATDENGNRLTDRIYPLQGLTTRAADDAAIALLDAWATVADVLTFYQERIANEGYLRTATERRSILELARLVGYALRPGVAASVYLAYTLDDNLKQAVDIAVGTRAQSVPGPGELPQSFETSEVLNARAAWNTLKPRLSQPQKFETIVGPEPNEITGSGTLYLKGIATNLKPNDPLLLVDPQPSDPKQSRRFVRVNDVQTDPKNNRTLVNFKAVTPKPAGVSDGDQLLNVINGLSISPSVPPVNTLRLSRSVNESFASGADTGLQIVNTLRPDFKAALSTALANVPVTAANPLEVYTFRVKAGVYGSTAALKSITDERGREIGKQEWPINGTQTIGVALNLGSVGDAASPQSAWISVANANEKHILLDLELPKDGITTKVGDIEFAFDKQENFRTGYHINYSGTQLTYTRHESNSIDVTISVSRKPARKINIALGRAAFVTVQSHGFKIEYARSDAETFVLSLTDEAPLSPKPKNRIALDGIYDQIAPGSWFVITRPDGQRKIGQVIGQVKDAQTIAKTDYNFPAKVTELTLHDPTGKKPQDWLTASDLLLSDIRSTTVFAQSEKLELAEEPITQEICGGVNDQIVEIELDGLYTDLKSGRWLIVAGERADIKDENQTVVDGLKSAELVMLAGVRHGHRADLPGDKTHTFITLARQLAYCYQRDKVTIYGNVVKATHGETRSQVLGNGDGSKALQSFDLKQPPLTYVAAPNPSGVDSTLQVYVNDVEWHAADTLAGLAPTAHNFTTRTNDEGKTTVIFGNGQQGARLPTGIANVQSVYRNGIGKPGNVQAEQINLLIMRPLGVRAVVNPLRAAGGADKESRDQARQNAPLAVTALDRLVSVQDYADFARSFAGVGKAVARRISDGRRELVHITIAGADDIPIDETSDLYRNLRLALRQYGDPDQPFQLAVRELLLLVISANVQVLPDYLWEPVATKIRCKLLDTFGFERRELGQNLALSEVFSAIQAVEGVAYVDADILGGIPEKKAEGGNRRLLTPTEITATVQAMLPQGKKVSPQQYVRVNFADFEHATLRPAQLAFLTPAVPDTLILNPV